MCEVCETGKLTKELAEATLKLSRQADARQQLIAEYGGLSEEEMKTHRHNAAVRGLSAGALAGKSASPELVADVQEWVAGRMTTEQITQRLIAREQEKQKRREGEDAPDAERSTDRDE
jgi:hypothetical protein